MKAKHLMLLALMPMVSCCTGGQGGAESETKSSWATASLNIKNPIAPGDTLCYQIKIELDTLSAENDLARNLSAAICENLLPERNETSVATAMMALSDSLETEWKQIIADMYDPESEFNDMFQYHYAVSGKPLDSGRDDILSYEMATDCYLGGAHGSYVVEYCNFDKNTGKRLGIKDIVPADKEMLVLMAMEEQLCKDFDATDLPDLQSKTGITALGDLYLTNNFRFKGDSIQFLFNQYEIAPYAAGLIKVTLPCP